MASLPVRLQLIYKTALIEYMHQRQLYQHSARLTSVMSRGFGVSSVLSLYTFAMSSHRSVIDCGVRGFIIKTLAALVLHAYRDAVRRSSYSGAPYGFAFRPCYNLR